MWNSIAIVLQSLVNKFDISEYYQLHIIYWNTVISLATGIDLRVYIAPTLVFGLEGILQTWL